MRWGRAITMPHNHDPPKKRTTEAVAQLRCCANTKPSPSPSQSNGEKNGTRTHVLMKFQPANKRRRRERQRRERFSRLKNFLRFRRGKYNQFKPNQSRHKNTVNLAERRQRRRHQQQQPRNYARMHRRVHTFTRAHTHRANSIFQFPPTEIPPALPPSTAQHV